MSLLQANSSTEENSGAEDLYEYTQTCLVIPIDQFKQILNSKEELTSGQIEFYKENSLTQKTLLHSLKKQLIPFEPELGNLIDQWITNNYDNKIEIIKKMIIEQSKEKEGDLFPPKTKILIPFGSLSKITCTTKLQGKSLREIVEKLQKGEISVCQATNMIQGIRDLPDNKRNSILDKLKEALNCEMAAIYIQVTITPENEEVIASANKRLAEIISSLNWKFTTISNFGTDS
ncbi:MAG: hypothetical protein LBP31_02710 [Holosporales bacterium]|jgi:murein L,D-transpeptidase YafK|nr:hypothetical protein [Holosporales bacterium]